jgi:iron complex transport system substrate-binding protein
MKRPKKEQDAIWVGGGGQSIGVPSVGADWMRLAGLKQRPVSGGRVSLEDLLVRPPSVLVQSRYRSGQMSRGTAWLNHPILREAKTRRLQVDGRAWTCMGPLVIPEIERLRSVLR